MAARARHQAFLAFCSTADNAASAIDLPPAIEGLERRLTLAGAIKAGVVRFEGTPEAVATSPEYLNLFGSRAAETLAILDFIATRAKSLGITTEVAQ